MEVETEEMTWKMQPPPKRSKVLATQFHNTPVEKLQMLNSAQVLAKGKDQTSNAGTRSKPESSTDIIDVEKIWAFHWQSVPAPERPQVALVIQKHWCDQILYGNKTWEIRGNALKRRGRICIAQSKSNTLVGEVSQWQEATFLPGGFH